MGGFSGGVGVSLCRRSRAPWVGSDGVVGGHFLQQPAPILGGCGLLLIAGEGNITNVVVTPEARRRGVATGLLRYLVEKGDRAGLTAYTLEVRVSNAAAIGLYEKLGFVSEGIRPDFYEKPTEDAVIMWKR